MSRFEEIEAFVRTVDTGSFTAAAEQLRVAKSAISRRINELEQRLGAQLMIRTTRKLTLTESGQALYQRGKALLEDWNEAEGVVSDQRQALAGRIRLAAPLSFGIKHLGPMLLEFNELHPDIEFDIDFSDRQVDLVAEGIDLALRIGTLGDSSLVARKLAPIRMIAATSPAYLKRVGAPSIPADLKDWNELRYALRPVAPWTFTAQDGTTDTIRLSSDMRASNGEFLTEAAIAGRGLTIHPSFILYEALRAGDLVQILPDHTLAELGLYAVYPPTRHLSKRVRMLVDFLAVKCGETPYWDEW